MVAAAGAAWLMLGLLVYVPYRRARGLDLTTTHKVAIPQPVVDHEAEYDSVLVALNTEEGYRESLVATAVRLAARKRRGIHVLVTIPVPNSLAIDARLPEAERAADSIIEQARVVGGRRVNGHWEKVRGRSGRAAHHRGGRGHAGDGDRDRPAAPDRRVLAVRQDARDRARRPAVPRRDRVDARTVPTSARQPPPRCGRRPSSERCATHVMPALMFLVGVAVDRPHARGRRRPDGASACCWASCSRSPEG